MADKQRGISTYWRTAITVVLALIAVAAIVSGCGDMQGTVSANQLPTVEFTNTPANRDTFSFSPQITWKGRDPDGFVESYSYADITDSTALLDPAYYVNFIPPEAWVDTSAMAATVYLLTEAGRVTEHVFYLKCRDDRGLESLPIHRTFYRTNRPPLVPDVKWFLSNDDTYGHTITVSDTLYCLNEPNETWPGLGFNWRSTDPDDRELYRIPLQYRYYLEKTPHDTVWEWTSRNWTSRQDLTFAGLSTGHYVFTVWARDDGFEISEQPATATFDVYEPSFEQSVLLFDCTYQDAGGRLGRGNIVPGAQVGDLYRQLASRYPDAEYAQASTSQPYKSFLGRFKLVIMFSENFTSGGGINLTEYAHIGGKVWVLGSFIRKNLITNTTLALAGCTFAGPSSGVNVPTNEAEFTGATAGPDDLQNLTIDTAKCAEMFKSFWDRGYKTYPLLPGVDILTAGNGTETAYYFKSYTDTASGDVFNELAEVKANIDTINYPPTPVDCLIKLNRKRVLEVTRVENITRGVQGQVLSLTNNVGSTQNTVVRVSYPYGQPWSISDTVRVDYRFQPYSDFHLRPCGIRYEKLVVEPGATFAVRYRVAVFAFPLYYMNNTNGEVNAMFNTMLDWFFLPHAHSSR